MRTLFVVTLFCGLCAAQTLVVSPRYHRRAEGLSSNVFPFGNTVVPFRYQQIHDDVPAMTISGLGFRPNVGVASPAHSVTLDAWLSTATTSSAGIGVAFDNNHGADKLQVIRNRTFNHPAADPGFVPANFVLQYPFDAPFAYRGQGSLCWEVQVTGKTQSSPIQHDAVNAAVANPPLQITSAGVGCRVTAASSALEITGSSTMNWPGANGVLSVTCVNALANGVAVHALGFDRTQWGGLPLPFELPGSSAAPSGACFVYGDVLLTAVLAASGNGTVVSSLNVPATPNLNGTTTLSQVWALAPAANPLGLATSALLVHNFVAPTPNPPVSRVFVSGGLGASGMVNTTIGLVTRLF